MAYEVIKVGADPKPVTEKKEYEVLKAGKGKPSRVGSIVRTVARRAGPVLGSIAGTGTGLTLGTALAPSTGGLSLLVPLLALGGGFVGGGITGKVQSELTKRSTPGSLLNTLKATEAEDRATYPYATGAADIVTSFVGSKPSPSTLLKAAKSAPALLRGGRAAVTAKELSAIINVAGGAAIGGGAELGSQLLTGEGLDPMRIAGATAVGAVQNKPTRLGKFVGFKGEPPLEPADLHASAIKNAVEGKPIDVQRIAADKKFNDPQESFQFFSRNIEENVDRPTAIKRLSSDEQASYRAISDDIDKAIGIKSVNRNSVGDWSDGAENAVVSSGGPGGFKDFDEIKYSVAWKGISGNQKQVIPFVSGKDGKHLLYSIDLPNHGIVEATDIADKAGIAYKTIEPVGKGTRLYVFDMEGSPELAGKIQSLGKTYGAKNAKVRKGTGEFFGGETRAQGLQAFRKFIREYESRFPDRGRYRPGGRNVLPVGRSPALQKEVVSPKKLSDDLVKYAEENKDRLVDAYIEKYGNVVSSDDAKDLFVDKGYNRLNAVDFHEASSVVSNAAYLKLLESRKGQGNNTVLFSAGGPGAGKTTGLAAAGLTGEYAVTVDSNLQNFDSAVRKINKALDAGYNVDIVYVSRDPVEAFREGVIPRALREGRVVPKDIHAEISLKSAENLGAVAKHFEGDDRVSIIATLNKTGERAKLIPVNEIPKMRYNKNELEAQLDEAIQGYEREGLIQPEFGRALRGGSDEGSAGVQAPLGQKERGFAETVRTSPATEPAVAEKVNLFYTPLANKTLLKTARDMIARNPDEAYSIARDQANPSPEASAISMILIDDAQKAGRFQEAIDLVEVAAKRATTISQAVQALSIYGRLTPEGALQYAQRLVSRANRENPTRNLKITPQKASAIRAKSAPLASLPEGRAKVLASAKLMDEIASIVPSDFLSKISMGQTLAQLLNFKTAARNIIGDAGFAMLENVSDVVAAGVDVPVTGIRNLYRKSKGLEPVTRSKVLPDLRAQAGGFMAGGRLGFQDAIDRIDTFIGATQFDIPRSPVFRGKVGGGLTTLLNLELKVPDRAFFMAAYEGSLANQMKVSGATQATEAMKEIAVKDGLFRTFQDDNVFSRFFTGIKRALNLGKPWGAGDILLKYPKTPGAIMARGLIDYSPAGFIKSLKTLADTAFTGKAFDQRAAVEAFGRATVGTTGLMAFGFKLKDLGIITSRQERDRDIAAVQKEAGLGGYRINVSALKRYVLSGFNDSATALQPGDTQVSYDWLQPAAIGVSLGANIREGIANRKAIGISGTVASSLEEAVNTLAEQPMVSGFTRYFQSYNPSEGAVRALEGVPASVVPTILSQIRQLTDNTSKEIKDPNRMREVFNITASKIPVLSKDVPAKVTPFGREAEMYHGGGNTIFNVFFNPAFVSKYAPSQEAKIVLDIYQSTGQTEQAPRIAPWRMKVNGRDMELTADQRREYQRVVGTLSSELFRRIGSDPEFISKSDEEKARILGDVVTDVGTAGKILVFGSNQKIPKDVQRILFMAEALNSSRLKGNGNGKTKWEVIK